MQRRASGLVLVGVLAVTACSGGDKPITEQSCDELATTYDSVVEVLRNSDAPFEETQEASEAAGDIENRQAELGGCPGEPSLQ